MSYIWPGNAVYASHNFIQIGGSNLNVIEPHEPSILPYSGD